MQLIAWIGQTQCDESKVNNDQDVENCAKLNGAPSAYFDAGLLKVEKAMTFNYMGTRNNNFSNRSQKGQIVSEQVVQTFAIVLLSLSSAAMKSELLSSMISCTYARSETSDDAPSSLYSWIALLSDISTVTLTGESATMAVPFIMTPPSASSQGCDAASVCLGRRAGSW